MNLAGTIKHPLKTALAAALAMAAYRALHLPHGYWAPISAIIVMQSNLGRSIHASSNRLLGTIAGAAIATVVLWIGGSNVVTLAIAVGLTVWLLALVKLQESVRLGGVTAAIVMLISEGSAWRTGMSRFIDVALGVVIALIVSVAWPSRARTQLREALFQTFAELAQLFEGASACCLGKGCEDSRIDALRSQAVDRSRRNAELVRDLRREPAGAGLVLGLLQESAERIRGHLFAIDNAARSMQHDTLALDIRAELEELFTAIAGCFSILEEDLSRHAGPTPSPDLDASLERLEERFAAMRAAGVTRTHDLDETLRFFALLHRLRQLVPELQRSAEFANAAATEK
jgi:uncharacterized membrane protein YccC